MSVFVWQHSVKMKYYGIPKEFPCILHILDKFEVDLHFDLTSWIVGVGWNIHASFKFTANLSFSSRNPSLKQQLFSYAILGFALSEAMGLFCLMVAFLILFAMWILAVCSLTHSQLTSGDWNSTQRLDRGDAIPTNLSLFLFPCTSFLFLKVLCKNYPQTIIINGWICFVFDLHLFFLIIVLESVQTSVL